METVYLVGYVMGIWAVWTALMTMFYWGYGVRALQDWDKPCFLSDYVRIVVKSFQFGITMGVLSPVIIPIDMMTLNKRVREEMESQERQKVMSAASGVLAADEKLEQEGGVQ